MRLIAFSLNAPTPAFTAAMAALRSLGHIVDFYPKRSFAESTHGYQALLLSLGDVMLKDAQQVKLAAMKAACTLPTCLFFDRPFVREITPEAFWASSVVDETTNDRVHRSEMLVALKGEWRANIEDRLARWMPGVSRGIVPAFDYLKQSQGWEPTAWHFTPALQLRKTADRTEVMTDAVDLNQIAYSSVIYRQRVTDLREERWSNLPIDCARLRTVYLDELPFHECEDTAWMNGRLPAQPEINHKLDEQIAVYLGVRQRTKDEAARKLDGLIKDELNAGGR